MSALCAISVCAVCCLAGSEIPAAGSAISADPPPDSKHDQHIIVARSAGDLECPARTVDAS